MGDALLATAGLAREEGGTVRVVAQACGVLHFGSGFALGTNEIITNAHVVAGAGAIQVTTAANASVPARLVLLDPQRDIAVLRIRGLVLAPLRLASGPPGRLAYGIGYPLGGSEQTVRGVVQRMAVVEVPDIYGAHLVRREAWLVSALLRHGNSGGPLVNRGGAVIGVIFASSTDDPQLGFALTVRELVTDLRAAQDRFQTISPGPCR